MSEKGLSTRQKIVKTAQDLVLRQGFPGTSLDDVLRETGLTKGAFFHHFKSKAELGQAILTRYADTDLAMFHEFSQRADRLSDDPFERAVIFLKLLEEVLDGLKEPPVGCIFGSYIYARGSFDRETLDFVRDQLLSWQNLYEAKFDALIKAYPPARPVTAKALAEMIAAMFEGAFILGNAYSDREFMKRQSQQFREYLALLFGRPAA